MNNAIQSRFTQGAGGVSKTQQTPSGHVDFENLRVDDHIVYRDGGTRLLTMRPIMDGLPIAPEAGQVRMDGAINSPTRGKFYFTPVGGEERPMTFEEISGLFKGTQAQLFENPGWSTAQASRHQGLIADVKKAIIATAGPGIRPPASPFTFADGFDR